jgi:hypothetical protein
MIQSLKDVSTIHAQENAWSDQLCEEKISRVSIHAIGLFEFKVSCKTLKMSFINSSKTCI